MFTRTERRASLSRMARGITSFRSIVVVVESLPAWFRMVMTSSFVSSTAITRSRLTLHEKLCAGWLAHKSFDNQADGCSVAPRFLSPEMCLPWILYVWTHEGGTNLVKSKSPLRIFVFSAFAAVALLSLTGGAGAVQGDKKI